MSDARLDCDVVIVGAGVVGAAIARELSLYELRCILVEAGTDVGVGTSKANTALLHTGFDVAPGSLEARLVRRGHELLSHYAESVGIPVERTGALLIAWSDAQHGEFRAILDRAGMNGCTDLRELAPQELYEREPNIAPGARGAIHIPGESIICPFSCTLAFATEAVLAGCELRLETRVVGIERLDGLGFRVLTSRGPITSGYLINAAGLSSDELDRMLGFDGFTITPRRGELMVFDKLARPLVNHILLPVRTAESRGVLVAPTVYGNVMVGPTAENVPRKDDTSSTAAGLAFVHHEAERIVPELVRHDVTSVYAGLRAATEHADYQVTVHARDGYACVGGIRSTGLSASLAIAEHVRQELEAAGLELTPRPDAPCMRLPNIGEAFPRPYAQPEKIAEDREYGRIVCYCERVTYGEIRDALSSPIPPRDLDGLRRRTRAVMGRCQGFFCGAQVAELLAAGSRRTQDLAEQPTLVSRR